MDSNSLLLPFLLIALTPTITSSFNNDELASTLSACLTTTNIRNFTMSSPHNSINSSSSLYDRLLNVSIHNLRFAGPSTPKPLAIILPHNKNQLRSAMLCCRRTSLTIRIRSGGHSYEGQSYLAPDGQPFAIIDMMNLNAVNIDTASATAWMEAGATLGEIYYKVTAKSNGTLALSAGSCPTVGAGGHIGGGGFGFLSRKYGLAADNVIDAILIDADGRILDSRRMREDVFWAIRGGGGGSWGVVYAWRIRLVPVPSQITRFRVERNGTNQHIAGLLHKWQLVAPALPDEYYLSTVISGATEGPIHHFYSGLFLGPKDKAVSILQERFPELSLRESDCVQESWIECAVFFAGLDAIPELKDRNARDKSFSKFKSDYVQAPISVQAWVGVLEWIAKMSTASVLMDPYGGVMSRIGSGDLPFPHRAGNLYGIQYIVDWTNDIDKRSDESVHWLREFYEYMTPFVSKNPRAAYVNYLDLDLGISRSMASGADAVAEARVWGEKYFMWNFDRLVRAKTQIDPHNVFNNEQSIPPSGS